MGAEISGSMPGPTRIVEHPSREGHEVCIAGADDRLRLFEAADESDGNDRHRRRGLDRARQWNLIARPDRNLLRRRKPAARNMNRAASGRFELAGESNGISYCPATFDPIRS